MTSEVTAGAPVVVGVDGSIEALRAVDLAARLANERQRTLRVVHAFIWPELHVPLGPAPGAPADAGLAHDAERVLATALACAEASAAGTGVTALLALRFPVAGEPGDMVPLVYSAEDLADEEAVVLAEAVAGCRERYPDVPLRTLVVKDRPARALVHASERARLVVVGSRGLGGFTGLLLGAVSHALIHHASCPVAIVR